MILKPHLVPAARGAVHTGSMAINHRRKIELKTYAREKFLRETVRLFLRTLLFRRPNCPEHRAIRWFNQRPVMAEHHFGGISHFSGDCIFVLRESVEIGAERMAQGIMGPGLYARFFSNL